MKPAVKYTSFEELKSSTKDTLDTATRLKKHNEFEKFMKELRSVKVKKSDQSNKR
jgi:hypothetical protein